MSFIKKAVKKVFKVVKKIVKKVVKSKWFKIAAIAALTFFTAGVATVGFAAFSGVTTIGGFFGAVGSTMASGFTGIVGGLKAGLGLGQSGAIAGSTAPVIPGAAAGIGVQGTGMGIGVEAAAGAGGSIMSAASQQASLGLGSSILGQAAPALVTAGSTSLSAPAAKTIMGKVIGGLFGDTATSSMLRTGLILGIQGYQQGKMAEQQKFYRDNANVWGTAAFGGDGKGWDLPTPVFGDPSDVSVAAAGAVTPQDPSAGLLAGPTGAPAGQGQVTPQEQAQQQAAAAAAQQQAATPGLLAQAPPPPGGPPRGEPQYDPYGGVVA